MLTKDLDIPNKTIEQQSGWSIRRLLSLGGSVGKVVSLFNPFEFIFFIMVLFSGIAEILSKKVSLCWYVITILVLVVAFLQRRQVSPEEDSKEPKIK